MLGLRLHLVPTVVKLLLYKITTLRSHCQPRLGAIVLWALRQIWEVTILGNEDNKCLQIAGLIKPLNSTPNLFLPYLFTHP